MTEEQKRTAIEEFFLAPKPHLHPKSIAIGVVIFLFGVFAMLGDATGFGVAMCVVGIAWAALLPLTATPVGAEPLNEACYSSIAQYGAAQARYDARPSEGQMMSWLKEDLVGLETASIDRLGLEETTRDPITVIGPQFGEHVDGLSNDVVLRRRVPNGYFYSTYRASVFQFTDNFLGSYQANFNMIRNVTTGEETDEFFYRDVVSVRTQTQASSYVLKTGEKLEHSKTFSLAVSSGDKISVVINDPKIKAATEIETLGDEAVNNVRAMLRQYKQLEQAV